MEKNMYNYYCDLDGVLANFNKAYYELTGVVLDGHFYNDPAFWNPINKAGVDFWVNLEWMPDGKELWNYIKEYNPKILSAPSREDSSRIGKFDWVKRELPGVELILRTMKHKKDFAAPNAILIDDNKDNIKSWVDAGGIGIHHTSTADTINQLKKLEE